MSHLEAPGSVGRGQGADARAAGPDPEQGREHDRDLDVDLETDPAAVADGELDRTADDEGHGVVEDLEAPEEDAAEQQRDLRPRPAPEGFTVGVAETDPADRYEQEQVVALDEDDYR